MPRPMPAFPRGGRRRKRSDADLFLSVPKLDPEWELAALHALMKPPRKRLVVQSRQPEQVWNAAIARRAVETLERASSLLEVSLEILQPPEGDLHLLVRESATDRRLALDRDRLHAIALAVSKSLPDHSIRVGKLVVRNGQFFRRRRGIELQLGPARDIHVRKALRAALATLL